MKKAAKYLSVLLFFAFAITITSCGDDEPNAPEADIIYVSSNDSQDITLRYDQSETPNAIKFTATGDWTAEIYPANANFQIVDSKTFSKVDWLEIAPYKGSAGSWSCELFAAPNRDAQSRYAVVVLNSIKSKVRFEVTQEGMPGGTIGGIVPPSDQD